MAAHINIGELAEVFHLLERGTARPEPVAGLVSIANWPAVLSVAIEVGSADSDDRPVPRILHCGSGAGESSSGEHRYVLAAVVIHHIRPFWHYTACVLNGDGDDWLLYDDAHPVGFLRFDDEGAVHGRIRIAFDVEDLVIGG
jgi:hypothetical protein